MNRSLFLCNTVYQVFVAIWMKHSHLKDCPCDIIVSDHMNGGKTVYENVRKYGEFDKCYYVESKSFIKNRYQVTPWTDRGIRFWPQYILPRYIDLTEKYSTVYLANVDRFSDFLYNSLIHRNKNCKLYIFEDGLSTYSKLYELFYNECKLPQLDLIHGLIRYVFKETGIYGNLSGMYLFHPENVQWDVPCPLLKICNIDRDDQSFVEMCNRIFGYYESKDVYDKKYIFMEESYAADGKPINDVELLEELAKRVGKDNVMVKIHPRNPINRFAERGFKTNVNTSIPWEIILLNLKDISDKVFLTVASGSVLNPILLFGAEVHAYSLYHLVDQKIRESSMLNGDFWNAVYNIMNQYPENITICKSLDEII